MRARGIARRRPAALLAGSCVLALAAGCGGMKGGGLLTAPVETGVVRRSVSATGTLKAVVTVQVGSQVTGVVQSMGADFNSVVKAGQVVARIDPATFQAQVERAQADLASSRARVKSAEAAVLNQRANAAAARANLEGAVAARGEAERVLRRSRELSAEKLVSTRELEAAESAAEQARARASSLEAQILQSEAQMSAAAAQLEEARAQVQQAEAQVSVAKVNLDHTVIASPIDGVVIARRVDVGQTVAASLQAPTLFEIANDLTKMNVIASIDEADIGAINEATAVTFTVDAFPGENFSGRVRQVRLEPLTQQNVVTYSVIIDVDNGALKLRPGMTANVTMTIAEQTDVLKVPNAALRFWPEDVPRERMAEILGGPKSAGSPVPSAAAPGASPALARLREDSLPGDERKKRREEFRALPEAERQKLRESWGGGMGGPGSGRRRRGGEEGGRESAGAGSTASGELRFPAPPPVEPRPRVVWVEAAAGKLEPRRVMVTITDGQSSAVVGGDLREGDKVVVGRAIAGSGGARAQGPIPVAGPMAGGGRGGGGGRR